MNELRFKILVMKKIHFTFSFPSLRVRSKIANMIARIAIRFGWIEKYVPKEPPILITHNNEVET